MTQTYHITDLASWAPCLEQLERTLRPGMIVALSGPLGAGKTTFVQALAKHLGSEVSPRSPTFSLLRTYPLKKTPFERLLHVDAYRIEQEEDLRILNLEEELEERGTIAAIEWPEQIPGWIDERTDSIVRLTITQDGEERTAMLEWKS